MKACTCSPCLECDGKGQFFQRGIGYARQGDYVRCAACEGTGVDSELCFAHEGEDDAADARMRAANSAAWDLAGQLLRSERFVSDLNKVLAK